MKKLLFISLLLLGVTSMSAQTYKIVDNELVQVVDSTKVKKSKDTLTKLTVDKSGTEYPVYKSVRGSYYIKRVSKNTGKEYKQYLKLEE
jgi:hypothetical protein